MSSWQSQEDRAPQHTIQDWLYAPWTCKPRSTGGTCDCRVNNSGNIRSYKDKHTVQLQSPCFLYRQKVHAPASESSKVALNINLGPDLQKAQVSTVLLTSFSPPATS
jgi:hypothetical protein